MKLKLQMVFNYSFNKENEEDDTNLYRGISYRKFNRKFTLADDIIVKDAKLQDGLLKISLKRLFQRKRNQDSSKLNKSKTKRES